MDFRSSPGKTLLSLVVIVQLFVLVQSTLIPALMEILDTRDYQAVERSAMIAFGDDIAEFIRFVGERTNEVDFVLIPSPEAHEVMSHVGIMQYYLIPRNVSNCPINQSFQECFQIQGGPKTSILSVNGFPPIGPDEEEYWYESFDQNWGIFIPITHSEKE